MTDLGPFVLPAKAPRPRLLSPWQHRLACWGCMVAAALLGARLALAYGAIDRDETDWPWEVRERTLVTPEVAPGGNLIMRRVIEYHEDCDIRYVRRVQSQAANGRRHLPPNVAWDHPPWDRSGKPQEFSIPLPANFTCGPAYLVESVSAACNLLQRYVRRLQKPDIITPFTVSCPAAR